MPRIFSPAEALRGSEMVLVGPAQHYVARVLRMVAGDGLVLFDGRGQEVQATVARIGARGVTLRLGERTQVAPSQVPRVTLLQGLPRADRMDWIVQKASELGATRLVPVRTARTAAGQQGRLERWQRIARDAASQCGRAQVMELSDVVSMEVALDGLPETTGLEHRIMPWEEAPDAPSLQRLLSPPAPELVAVTVLIGPEGGLGVEEARTAMASGFKTATLGPRILRTETAAIAVLAVVQASIGGLGAP